MLNQLKAEYNKQVGKRDDLLSQKKTKEDKIDELKDYVILNKKISKLLQSTTRKIREDIKTVIENLVNQAIYDTMNDDNAHISLELTTKYNKPWVDIKMHKTVNGELGELDLYSNGGGYLDSIVFTLRFIFKELIKFPNLTKGSMLVDEPSAQVDKLESSRRFAQMVQKLSKKYNQQIIMVSHNTSLIDTADKPFMVTQNEYGISSIEAME